MTTTVMLYGAAGYSGRLIAEEARRVLDERGDADVHMVLAGREGAALEAMGRRLDMDWSVFGLDERADVLRGLADVDVLLNAAGPFAFTAERLAKSCLETSTHYVDINGEIDVYKKLDDLGRFAAKRDLSIVCAAGYSAAVSDLLLRDALASLACLPIDGFGTVRIALSQPKTLSRGSIDTALRSVREQVTVARERHAAEEPEGRRERLVITHVPIGRLERVFDFSLSAAPGQADRRVASAFNLVDTVSARTTMQRAKVPLAGIESYLEMPAAARLGYQAGTAAAAWLAIPAVRRLASQAGRLLPPGPTPDERENDRSTVVLQITDRFDDMLVDWRLQTPNVYDMTARLALEVALRVGGTPHPGWCTPGDVLGAHVSFFKSAPELQRSPLRNCVLYPSAETLAKS